MKAVVKWRWRRISDDGRTVLAIEEDHPEFDRKSEAFSDAVSRGMASPTSHRLEEVYYWPEDEVTT